MVRHTDYQGLKQCIISADVIAFTEEVLRDYGNLIPPNEGFLYWGGTREGGIGFVDMVIAPKCDSSLLRVLTSHHSNALVVKNLSQFKKIQIAQVHSHPSRWVGHSDGDDELAPFKANGLFSIVVPSYGYQGMLPLDQCGIHLYWNLFKRMQKSLVNRVFEISNNLNATIIDLRHV